MKEKWKTVREFPNYEISNLGQIKNHKGRILSQNDFNPYLTVTLCGSGFSKRMYIHRLVATEFLFPDPFGLRNFVNHKDGNKRNNDVSNLEWVSQKENAKHAADNFLSPYGEKNGQCKITDKEIREIFKLREEGVPVTKICNIYDICYGHVYRVLRGKRRSTATLY